MRAHIEVEWVSRALKIWLHDRAGKYIYIWRWTGETWEQEQNDESNELGPPSLVLYPEMLEAIIRESEGHVHAQEATVRHLDDAIAVRDRLLALVEKE